MLVLSRQEKDRIHFPALGISVQILRISGNKVRVGVAAPPEVKVVRHELMSDLWEEKPPQIAGKSVPAERLRRHFETASDLLTRLYRYCDSDTLENELVCEVMHHLHSIERQAATLKETDPPTIHPQRRRALLIEDNHNESKLLAEYLRMHEYEVAMAYDGSEALTYLEHNENPDVVLLDMMMPGMDGPTTIQYLRSDDRHRGLKIFAVSGGDPEDYGVEVSPDGVDHWFPKPLDPEQLVIRIADHNGYQHRTQDSGCLAARCS